MVSTFVELNDPGCMFGLAAFVVSGCWVMLCIDHGGRLDMRRSTHRIGCMYAVLTLVGRSEILWVNDLVCRDAAEHAWSWTSWGISFLSIIASVGGMVMLALRKLADSEAELARRLEAMFVALLFFLNALFVFSELRGYDSTCLARGGKLVCHRWHEWRSVLSQTVSGQLLPLVLLTFVGAVLGRRGCMA